MTIRKSTLEDIASIVAIHISAFPNFFLTSLGEDFLRFYYSCFVRSKGAIVEVAEDGGEIVGFSAASEICRGFNSHLIKNNLFKFGCLTLKLMFTSPKSLIRLAKNLTKKGTDVEDNEDYAELYSIGVSAEAQGRGIGKQLLAKTEQELKHKGVRKVSLTTDFYNNENTIGFYHSMGYETLYEFVTYPDRKMYRLIKTIQ